MPELLASNKPNIVVAVDSAPDLGKFSETLSAFSELDHGPKISRMKVGLTAVMLNAQPGLLSLCEQFDIEPMIDTNKPTDPSLDYSKLIDAMADQGYRSAVFSPTVGIETIVDKVSPSAKRNNMSIALALAPPEGKSFWKSEGGFVSNEMTTRTIVALGLWGTNGVVDAVVATPSTHKTVSRLTDPSVEILIPGAKAENSKEITLTPRDSLVVGRAITDASDPTAAVESVQELVAALLSTDDFTYMSY